MRLQEAPRALQEASERLLRAVCVEILFWTPFQYRFGPVFGGPGPSKLRFSYETSSKFRCFSIFSWSRFWTSFLDPLGLSFGSPLAPKSAETSLGIFLRAVQGPPGLLFFGLGGFQERSKSPPRGKRLPEQILDPSKVPPRPMLAPFWTAFRNHFEQIWSYVRTFLESF